MKEYSAMLRRAANKPLVSDSQRRSAVARGTAAALGLKGRMDEIPIPNLPLSPREMALPEQLSAQDLQAIDEALLSCTRDDWRKVAVVVSLSMERPADRYPGFSDVFYAERVRTLVDSGRLQAAHSQR
jgi:hypothetical protein